MFGLSVVACPQRTQREFSPSVTRLFPFEWRSRGGELCVPDADVGRAVMARLSKLPGFPNLRFIPGPEGEDSLGIVRWGEPEPAYPRGWFLRRKLARYDIESGRYYGYSEKAIRRFIEERYGRRMARAIMGR